MMTVDLQAVNLCENNQIIHHSFNANERRKEQARVSKSEREIHVRCEEPVLNK